VKLESFQLFTANLKMPTINKLIRIKKLALPWNLLKNKLNQLVFRNGLLCIIRTLDVILNSLLINHLKELSSWKDFLVLEDFWDTKLILSIWSMRLLNMKKKMTILFDVNIFLNIQIIINNQDRNNFKMGFPFLVYYRIFLDFLIKSWENLTLSKF